MANYSGSKGLYRSSGKENENFCPVFTSSTKRENMKFHVVGVQRRQTNVQKSVMHVQSCCFVSLNQLKMLFCRSRLRRRRLRRDRCLSSLQIFFFCSFFMQLLTVLNVCFGGVIIDHWRMELACLYSSSKLKVKIVILFSYA